ncbi:LysR family transcriptional regulator [Massilia putida]|uniref:LysR family transcriptional regulator n=1 Tax=Massilia putida TaxID=1141883 RepID=UPI001E61B531|nr:LysR family transcriptional regulator [Massilia putida]
MNDLRAFDLNLLVTLDALLTEANVTRAARRLHLSQSAVSGQLARLRQLFDDPLLLPADNGRGMTPTTRGLDLAEPVRAALDQLAGIVRGQPAFDPATAQRTFQIAASDLSTVVLGLPLAGRLAQCAGPGVRLAFRMADGARIAAQLQDGEVDLLIGSERMVPENMRARLLFDEHFVMVQRKGHPRGTAPLALDAYCALRHVLVSTSGGSLHGFMDEHLQALGRSRNVVLSVQSFALVPACCASPTTSPPCRRGWRPGMPACSTASRCRSRAGVLRCTRPGIRASMPTRRWPGCANRLIASPRDRRPRWVVSADMISAGARPLLHCFSLQPIMKGRP